MIKNLRCNVILITSEKTKITKTDIEKYSADYHTTFIKWVIVKRLIIKH